MGSCCSKPEPTRVQLEPRETQLQCRRAPLTRKKVKKLLRQTRGNYHDLKEELRLMMEYRANTVKEMNFIADELDRKHGQINRVRLVGSGAATAGAILVLIVGTGGGAVIAGGFALVAGTAANVGAQNYEKVLERDYLEKVQRIVEQDKTQCKTVERLWKEFENCCSEIIDGIQFREQKQNSIAEVFSTARDEVTTMKDAFSSFLGESTLEGNSSPLVAVIGLYNIYEFIKTLVDIHQGSFSKVAEDIREKSSQLEQQHRHWNRFFSL